MTKSDTMRAAEELGLSAAENRGDGPRRTAPRTVTRVDFAVAVYRFSRNESGSSSRGVFAQNYTVSKWKTQIVRAAACQCCIMTRRLPRFLNLARLLKTETSRNAP
jgi:hypothetical protein